MGVAFTAKKFTKSLEIEVDSDFSISFEESSALGDGAYEWSIGNGDETPLGNGVPVPYDCYLFCITGDWEGGNGATTVAPLRDTTELGATQPPNSLVEANNELTVDDTFEPILYERGQKVNFRTISAGSAVSGRVTAWFYKKKSSGGASKGAKGDAGFNSISTSPKSISGSWHGDSNLLPEIRDNDVLYFTESTS